MNGIQGYLISPFITGFKALLKRNGDLTPATSEQASILALVSKVNTVLDSLTITPGNFEAAVRLLFLLYLNIRQFQIKANVKK